MVPVPMRAFLAPLLVALLADACQDRETVVATHVTAPVAAPADGPNANAAGHGPHGVSETPTDQAAAVPAGPAAAAPPLDPAQMDMAGHACSCGGSCHCGHCAGMIAGCHCKPKRADGK